MLTVSTAGEAVHTHEAPVGHEANVFRKLGLLYRPISKLNRLGKS